MIRMICRHPFLFAVLSSLPYLVALFLPIKAAFVLVLAWTMIRFMITAQVSQMQMQDAVRYGARNAIKAYRYQHLQGRTHTKSIDQTYADVR